MLRVLRVSGAVRGRSGLCPAARAFGRPVSHAPLRLSSAPQKEGGAGPRDGAGMEARAAPEVPRKPALEQLRELLPTAAEKDKIRQYVGPAERRLILWGLGGVMVQNTMLMSFPLGLGKLMDMANAGDLVGRMKYSFCSPRCIQRELAREFATRAGRAAV